MALQVSVAAVAVAVAVAAAVAATPSLAATATASGDAATITDWWVVNATSGARLQPLQEYKPALNATIPSLLTIVVEPSTEDALPAVATIAAATAQSVRSRPPKLMGDMGKGQQAPRRLLPSPYSLVAHVRSVAEADRPAGPVPESATAWEPVPADDDLPIPTLAPGCEGPPAIVSTSSYGTRPWSFRRWIFSARARNCRGEANRFRLQIFTAPANRSGRPIRVFQRIDGTDPDYDPGSYPRFDPDRAAPKLNLSCLPRSVFMDMCVRPAVAAPVVCVRSTISTMPALPKAQVVICEPWLPPALTVAPGTSLTLKTKVSAGWDCTRDALADQRWFARLVGVVRRTDGTIRRGRSVWGPDVTINTLAGGVTPADDGAHVYVEFKRAECAGVEKAVVGNTDVDPWQLVSATVVSVAAAGSAAVIRQDTSVPVIHRVEYPRTRWGQPVEVRVHASVAGQRGLWRAENGSIVPTALTYQWYLSDKDSSHYVDKLVPLAGQTGSVLALDKAVCNNPHSCGRYGCSGLVRYVAEVCSTAGCTRSQLVYPVVAAPADEALAARLLYTNECLEFA